MPAKSLMMMVVGDVTLEKPQGEFFKGGSCAEIRRYSGWEWRDCLF